MSQNPDHSRERRALVTGAVLGAVGVGSVTHEMLANQHVRDLLDVNSAPNKHYTRALERRYALNKNKNSSKLDEIIDAREKDFSARDAILESEKYKSVERQMRSKTGVAKVDTAKEIQRMLNVTQNVKEFKDAPVSRIYFHPSLDGDHYKLEVELNENGIARLEKKRPWVLNSGALQEVERDSDGKITKASLFLEDVPMPGNPKRGLCVGPNGLETKVEFNPKYNFTLHDYGEKFELHPTQLSEVREETKWFESLKAKSVIIETKTAPTLADRVRAFRRAAPLEWSIEHMSGESKGVLAGSVIAGGVLVGLATQALMGKHSHAVRASQAALGADPFAKGM